jgi:hypothetical protein
MIKAKIPHIAKRLEGACQGICRSKTRETRGHGWTRNANKTQQITSNKPSPIWVKTKISCPLVMIEDQAKFKAPNATRDRLEDAPAKQC